MSGRSLKDLDSRIENNKKYKLFKPDSVIDSERSSARSAERSDFIILWQAKRARSLLTARGLSQLRNSRLHK